MRYKSESGRSMLEMLMVISVISLLTMGGLMGYQQVIASHSATSIKEDVLVQAQSLKGHNYHGKSIYDSGIGKKTRLGLTMTTDETSSTDTFSVIVRSVSTRVCQYLSRLDWKDAVRLKIDYEAFPPKSVDCSALNQSGEKTFDLEVLFPRNAESISGFDRTCGNCMSCEKCNTITNACVNDCTNSEDICVNNGCVPKRNCSRGLNLKNGECEVCATNYLETCSSCANAYETKPYWHDSTCVCYGGSCGAGFYCADSGECDTCPENATCPEGLIVCNSGYYPIDNECVECNPPEQESCQLEETTYDDLECPVNKKITCSGDTPACFDNGTCQACPDNATCTDGEIICDNSGETLITVNVGNVEHKICCPIGQTSTDGTTCTACATDGLTTCASCPSATPYYVQNFLADGSGSTSGGVCCASGYPSAVDGTCCNNSENYCKTVSYLQSNGTQYIDTGIKYHSTMSIKGKYSRLGMGNSGSVILLSTNTTTPVFYFPALDGNLSYDRFVLRRSGYSEQKYAYLFNSYPLTHTAELNYEEDNLYLDNTIVKSGMITGMNGKISPYYSTSNMYMFGIKNTYRGYGKVYYCKIWDNNTLVRDFIPAIDKEGKAGMYDSVSGTMFYNLGSGKFSAG